MRAGPQLGVDAYGVRRYGSVMQVCKQPCATLALQAFAKTHPWPTLLSFQRITVTTYNDTYSRIL